MLSDRGCGARFGGINLAHQIETESLKDLISSVNPEFSYPETGHKSKSENRPSSLIYRLAKPHEVPNVVTFVASDRAAVINDGAIRVEGRTVPTVA